MTARTDLHQAPRSAASPVETVAGNSSAVCAETAAAQVLELQRQLQEKDQLVTALTDRLEQAAEQLDRIRRSGGDRAVRRGPGGVPPELLEEHRSAIDELKQSVARWEEMQAGLTLGRLESQVSELRDLILGNLGTGEPARRHGGEHLPTKRTPELSKAAAAGPTSWWEQQKASLLEETVPEERPPAVAAETAPPASLVSLAELRVPDLPPPVDLDSLPLEAAREAVRQRDRLIETLREQVLLAQAREAFAGYDLEAPDLPAGLRERIALFEQQWTSKFRQLELDLSIERAQLARDEAMLQGRQEMIDKELVRLGLHPAPDRHSAVPPEQSTRKRWFAFLQSDEDKA